MGIFDFIKAKNTEREETSFHSIKKYECEADKTITIVELLNTPKEKRDKSWHKIFFENIQTARFSESIPQILFGPDGFPYFILKTNEPYNPFDSFCIRNMMSDFILDKGFGIVLNPSENDAEFVFSYGDILNLSINNEFITETDIIIDQRNEIIKKDTEVLISQPSENYLPLVARKNIKKFLQNNGVKQPKLFMISKSVNDKIIHELVFNLFKDDLMSDDEFDYRLKQISWFLPKHYIAISIPLRSDLAKNFVNL